MKKLALLLFSVVVLMVGFYQFLPLNERLTTDFSSNGRASGPPVYKEGMALSNLVDSLANIHVLQTKAKRISAKEYLVSKGDTFSKILGRLKIDSDKVRKLSSMIHGKLDMSLFKIGQLISIYTLANENIPYKLKYQIDQQKFLEVDVKNVTVKLVEKPIFKTIKSLKSKIKTSLVRTLRNNDAPEDLADKLLSLFVWEVDFRKLRKGDSFQVTYEDQSIEGESIGSGKILSAYFTHEGKQYQAHYFEHEEIKGYFNQRGENISRAPLAYDLISSLYSKRRYHPVKRRYRAHLGVDFMADEGTPIIALKDGVITKARYGRANGNYVKIKHDESMATQYLHLSKINPEIREGMAIKRGMLIGEVGSTGLSSGPHLCLRLWKNGKQIDPLSYQFERREGIPPHLLNEFTAKISSQVVKVSIQETAP